jgi:hypothetical protein
MKAKIMKRKNKMATGTKSSILIGPNKIQLDYCIMMTQLEIIRPVKFDDIRRVYINIEKY